MKDSTLYISHALSTAVDHKGTTYGKVVFEGLTKEFKTKLSVLDQHKKNVWCRDYMPVKSGTNKYVQFVYSPYYMNDSKKWQSRIPDQNKLVEEVGLKGKVMHSDLILDGGAIEICCGKGIVSDRVFRDNNTWSAQDVIAELIDKLALTQLIVIPQHPYDFTGHVDGLVRFVNEDKVLISDLSGEFEKATKELEAKERVYRNKLLINWHYAFKMALYNAGLSYSEIPCTAHENNSDTSGNGIYLNFLITDELIVVPLYENKTSNKKAMTLIQKAYNRKVVGIDATSLAEEGGMINCVTWTK